VGSCYSVGEKKWISGVEFEYHGLRRSQQTTVRTSAS
jgi:hypothetical protein